MVKADLHTHGLRTSHHIQEGDLNKIVDITSKRLGKGGIIILVNCGQDDKRYEYTINQKGYLREWLGKNKNGAYFPKQEIAILSGREIQIKSNNFMKHLLGIGLSCDKYIQANANLNDAIKQIKDENGIIVAPHPYSGGLGEVLEESLEKNTELIKQFDAIEVHNGQSWFSAGANLKSVELYKKTKIAFPNLKIGALRSSDAHSGHEIATSWTKLDYSTNLNIHENFIEPLKNAIRETNLYTLNQSTNSYLGTFKHILALAPYIIADKFKKK